VQIEDLSQQAQMAAAEKFKAPEQPTPAAGEAPAATVQPLHESDEEEVTLPYLLTYSILLCSIVFSCLSSLSKPARYV